MSKLCGIGSISGGIQIASPFGKGGVRGISPRRSKLLSCYIMCKLHDAILLKRLRA